MTYKICSTCGKEKEETLEYFSFRNDLNKFRAQCKECQFAVKRKYYIENSEEIKAKMAARPKDDPSRIKNRERACLHYQNNQEQKKQYASNYRKEHPEYMQEWRANNKDKIRNTSKEWQKQKKSIDICYKLRCILSSAISGTLKNGGGSKKNSSFLNYLGYDIITLKIHLENQFDKKMNWDNYGSYWHIDHIIPQILLPYDDLTHPNVKICWDLRNLRPLEKSKNIKKGDKIILSLIKRRGLWKIFKSIKND